MKRIERINIWVAHKKQWVVAGFRRSQDLQPKQEFAFANVA
jgi:hypothetical protein